MPAIALDTAFLTGERQFRRRLLARDIVRCEERVERFSDDVCRGVTKGPVSSNVPARHDTACCNGKKGVLGYAFYEVAEEALRLFNALCFGGRLLFTHGAVIGVSAQGQKSAVGVSHLLGTRPGARFSAKPAGEIASDRVKRA